MHASILAIATKVCSIMLRPTKDVVRFEKWFERKFNFVERDLIGRRLNGLDV